MAKISYEEAQRLIRYDQYQEIATEYISMIEKIVKIQWSEVVEQYKETELDPFDENEENAYMLSMFEYRMTLMVVCCLCETWEQDMGNFLIETGISITDNDYNYNKNQFNSTYGIIIENYPRIVEMRKLVNAIKHGEGNSFRRLLTSINNDDILANSTIGGILTNGDIIKKKQRDFDKNALTSQTLNIVTIKSSINDYYKEILQFWKDVFSQVDASKTLKT